MFRRIIIVLNCLVLMGFLLTGCHQDEKRAKSIYKSLEKSAHIEQKFADELRQLKKASQSEQTIYNEIIALDINQESEIEKRVENAQTCNQHMRKSLQEAKNSFDNAYKAFLAVKPASEKIKKPKREEEVKSIIQLMEKRKDLFQSYFNKYIDSLKDNKDFYKQLQNEQIKNSRLEEEIEALNQSYSGMKKQEQKFNRSTKRFNAAKQQYYQNAKLDVEDNK
ncbi:YkyA family protein [Virgibacillus phasianinus]|uniref:YkyA family protein n=1 Tax=Virgibacillus phasianinus TaxID=2017483 RepID=UPI0012FE5C49|nr:YkyA family protein [Virgibacillus phasianinus]